MIRFVTTFVLILQQKHGSIWNCAKNKIKNCDVTHEINVRPPSKPKSVNESIDLFLQVGENVMTLTWVHGHIGKDNKWRKLEVSKWKWATTKPKGSSQGEQPRKCRMTQIHLYKCEKVLRRWVLNIRNENHFGS
jgi:hypothetical protein